MGVVLDQPKFPVVDRAPNVAKTVGNFNLSDIAKASGITLVGLPVGYLAGGSGHVRMPSMVCAGILGGLAGFMFAYQCSAARLMGFRPNEAEVKTYLRK